MYHVRTKKTLSSRCLRAHFSKRERPDHLAVCFDKGGSTDRVEMYQEYKANRDETPEGIKTAVPYIYEILKAMHKKQKRKDIKPLW